MPGFKFRYRLSGAAPTIQSFVMADASFVKGDLVNLEAGQADLAVTTDTNLVGVVAESKTGTPGTTKIEVYTDPDVVYGVDDANARAVGATLDLAGATGAQGVAASTNKEFVVVADKTAAQETLVRINVGKHYQSKAQ